MLFDAIGPATDQVDVRAFRTGTGLGGGTIAPTASTIWSGGAGSERNSPQHAVAAQAWSDSGCAAGARAGRDRGGLDAAGEALRVRLANRVGRSVP